MRTVAIGGATRGPDDALRRVRPASLRRVDGGSEADRGRSANLQEIAPVQARS